MGRTRLRRERITRVWGPNADRDREPAKGGKVINQGVRSQGFPDPHPASPDEAIRANRGSGGWKPIY